MGATEQGSHFAWPIHLGRDASGFKYQRVFAGSVVPGAVSRHKQLSRLLGADCFKYPGRLGRPVENKEKNGSFKGAHELRLEWTDRLYWHGFP